MIRVTLKDGQKLFYNTSRELVLALAEFKDKILLVECWGVLGWEV